jgi:translation initiation factor IF-3
LNDEIRAKEVRLVDENGEQKGIVSLADALRAAESVDLDLVEIVANAEPPVCKIMDFNKHLFDLKQKQKEAKKKQHQVQVKEIKLRPATDVGDYNVKLRAIIKFLEEGNKVKITLRFRGREMAHQQLGLAQLQKVEADVIEYGTVEQAPKMEGRQMGMLLGPIRKKLALIDQKSTAYAVLFYARFLMGLIVEAKKRPVDDWSFLTYFTSGEASRCVAFWPIGICRGNFSSGIIRCKSIFNKPFS